MRHSVDHIIYFFLLQDTAYPPLLFQILEDCWQQEHYLRPSAELLYTTIKELTGLSMEENRPSLPENSSVLLDSFTLHQQNRVSAAHCHDSRGGVDVCAAVSGQDGMTTDVVVMQYDAESDKSEMLFNVCVCLMYCMLDQQIRDIFLYSYVGFVC